MSEIYQVLYRKYRPNTWDQVIGQDEVKRILEGAIAQKKIPHALLFYGTKGIGKTSLARIFAKSLGVESIDINEIDGASYRGIENVRELRDNASALPFMSPYKVYIIDEVHMFTEAAFNAFLKILEEPPAHVVFILATTEKQKLPATIRSRLLECNLKTPDLKDLEECIRYVAKKESYLLDDDEIMALALSGNYAFRDTLGALERFSMAFDLTNPVDNELKKERMGFIGSAGITEIRAIIEAINEMKPEMLFEILDTYKNSQTTLKNMWVVVAQTMSEIIKLRILKKRSDDEWINAAVSNMTRINTHMVSLTLGLIIKILRNPDFVYIICTAESSNFFRK